MGDILTGKFGRKAQLQKVKRSSLCANGHHQWVLEKDTQFDVKQGKLLGVKRCKKCGKTRTQAT